MSRLSFSLPCWRHHDAVRTLCQTLRIAGRLIDVAVQMTESHYDGEKKSRAIDKFLQTFKSCFGHGPFEVDVLSRNEYRKVREPARGFRGEKVYGIQAEYLDEHNMAWSKPKKSRKQAR